MAVIVVHFNTFTHIKVSGIIIFMVVTQARGEVSIPHTAYFGLMSDLHIGASYTDHDLIRADLKRFANSNADILINGDVFDAILPKDNKRFDPTCLHPDLRGRGDVLNGALDMAMDILGPYRDRIKMIGCGNHETAVSKYHAVDPISILIHQLGDIAYGGYCGWYRHTWRNVKSERNFWSFNIRYHHGGGGGAPQTRGMIDFRRLEGYVSNADVLWVGHKHNRFVDSSTVREHLTTEGNIRYDNLLCVMTGSYIDNYKLQTSEDALKHGRRSTYVEDFMGPPQRKGGVLLQVGLKTASAGDRGMTIEALL